jgi:hypothetical protein
VRAGDERLGGKLVVARELDARAPRRDRAEAAGHDRRVVGAWRSNIRSFASAYASNVPWRSR